MGYQDRRVSEVMETEVVTLGVDDRLDLVDDIMRLGRIRHLPVLDKRRVVGVVSARDLLAASLSKNLGFEPQARRTFMRSVDVSEVMSRDPIVASPRASLRQAAGLIVNHKIGCLPVVERDGTLVGLLTETDLIRATLLGGADEDCEETTGMEKQEKAGIGSRIDHEFDALRRVRDELRVQVHLAAAEAKDLWEELEHKYGELEGRVKRLGREAEEPLEEVGEAAKLLLEEIRDGYRRVRDAL